MNGAEQDEIRRQLTVERTRILGAIASLHDNGRGDEEAGEPGGLGADMASTTLERELHEGLEEGAVQTLGQIDRALGRLAEGSYGVCERCGRPIAGERLQARPWATLCIDDQRLADRA